MKILFTSNAQVKQGDGKGPVFEKGRVYDLNPESAQHWIYRDLATADPDKIAAVEATMSPKKSSPPPDRDNIKGGAPTKKTELRT